MPDPAEGHARMVRTLQSLAESTLAGSAPYVGRGRLNAAAAELARLPEAPSAERFAAETRLAELRLLAGDVEAAIAGHRAAERLRESLGPAVDAAAHDYALGVAHMRLGEVQNCTVMNNADRCLFPIRGEGVHQRKEGSREAIRYLSRVLESPEADRRLRLKARWLLNIAHMTLGQHPGDVPPDQLIPEQAFRSDEPFPRFIDVAAGLGLDALTLAGSPVADDFDGDGLLDLMVSSWHPEGQLRFYRNEGDGRFSDRTASAGLTGLLGGLNLVQADYDDDGDLDLLVLRGAWLRGWGRHPNSLVRNEGDGTFVDVTFAAGLSPPDHPTQTAAWADYDNDGDLDLYVGNESHAGAPAPSQLFRNLGDGTFRDVAAEAGVQNDRHAKGVAWGDYDGDGLPDLYVSNLGQANRLYHNEGDGRFRDVAPALGVERPIRSFPVWFWDFDNDGALDLYVSSYAGDPRSTIAVYLGRRLGAPPARLYRGDGAGAFEDVAARQNLTRGHMPMGANFGDLDNDGFLDFYLGTGAPELDSLVPNVMYRNRAGLGFSDVTTAGGFGHLQKGHGIAFADFDNDGDQDVFAEMGGAVLGDAFMNALFRNPGFEHHWLKVRLVGVRSNRSAIGARIRVDVTAQGQRRSIHRTVSSGGSFGANPLRQEIGLGRATKVDALEVFWPASGETQRFTDLDADQAIEITEGRPTPRRLALPAFALGRAGPAPSGHEAHRASH